MAGLNGAAADLGPDPSRVWSRGLGLLMAAALALSMVRLRRLRTPQVLAPIGAWAQGAAVVALLVLCILAVAAGGYSPFLYYRF